MLPFLNSLTVCGGGHFVGIYFLRLWICCFCFGLGGSLALLCLQRFLTSEHELSLSFSPCFYFCFCLSASLLLCLSAALLQRFALVFFRFAFVCCLLVLAYALASSS